MTTKSWTVQIVIGEQEGSTHAEARLVACDKPTLTGVGRARLNPADLDVPAIGDELAAARALSSLSRKLLEVASADIEGMTNQHAHIAR